MKKLLIFILLFSISQSLNAAETGSILNDKEKTIREINKDIEKSEKKKEDLITTKQFVLDETLEKFLKKGLTKTDFNAIGELAKEYNNKKNILETKITQAAKNLVDTQNLTKDLADLTSKFYQNLLDFVDKDHYSNYLYYIKEQTHFYIEEEALNADITKKNEIKNEKIASIEEKIKEHNKLKEEALKDLVYSKVDEKITQLSKDTDFINLPIDEKVAFVNNILSKIEETENDIVLQNESAETKEIVKANNEKKIGICELMKERFVEFIGELKE